MKRIPLKMQLLAAEQDKLWQHDTGEKYLPDLGDVDLRSARQSFETLWVKITEQPLPMAIGYQKVRKEMPKNDANGGTPLGEPTGSASGRWKWRAACIKSHLAVRYGINVVNETHGGHAQHYGWPQRSVGVEWSWKRNTWFAGFEFWPTNAALTDAEPQAKRTR